MFERFRNRSETTDGANGANGANGATAATVDERHTAGNVPAEERTAAHPRGAATPRPCNTSSPASRGVGCHHWGSSFSAGSSRRRGLPADGHLRRRGSAIASPRPLLRPTRPRPDTSRGRAVALLVVPQSRILLRGDVAGRIRASRRPPWHRAWAIVCLSRSRSGLAGSRIEYNVVEAPTCRGSRSAEPSDRWGIATSRSCRTMLFAALGGVAGAATTARSTAPATTIKTCLGKGLNGYGN